MPFGQKSGVTLTMLVTTLFISSFNHLSLATDTSVLNSMVTVFKSPSCGCCTKWAEHMKANGFKVRSFNVNDVIKMKVEKGISQKLWSCHTAMVGDYVIEGHVPAADIKKLLAEKRPVAGLAVPGMPMGSPGMEGSHKDTYYVYEFDQDGNIRPVAKH